MAKVSIIVPVYNVEAYIEKCLESLHVQTLEDIEIIVVNDGSPDNSQIIIDRYATIDRRIIALQKENGGLSSARNYGFKYATGEYIGYVDSDDWIEPDMFEKMYNVAKEKSADVVVCDFYFHKADSLEIITGMNHYTDDMIKNYILNTPSACNKIYKRDLLNENYWITGVYYEDFASNYFLISKVNKIIHLAEPLYYYYQRPTSIMHEIKWNPKFRDILTGSERIIETLNNDEDMNKYREEFEFTIIDNLLRGTYFRFDKVHKKDENVAKLLSDIIDFFKKNIPHFAKNKYYKTKGVKHHIVTILIYKRWYSLLKLLIGR